MCRPTRSRQNFTFLSQHPFHHIRMTTTENNEKRKTEKDVTEKRKTEKDVTEKRKTEKRKT